MVPSLSSSAAATARSRTACRSRPDGITRYVSSARDRKSSTARGRFRRHDPRVEGVALRIKRRTSVELEDSSRFRLHEDRLKYILVVLRTDQKDLANAHTPPRPRNARL